jgi:hippurate hydrolase
MKKITAVASLACLMGAPVMAQKLDVVVNDELSNLVDTYKGIHSHPELSHHEEHTAALLAAELRKSGYSVAERVGTYPDGTQAYGVVATLQNGAGPKLLIRADVGGDRRRCEGHAGRSSVRAIRHAGYRGCPA